jgi:hypothetical protein
MDTDKDLRTLRLAMQHPGLRPVSRVLDIMNIRAMDPQQRTGILDELLMMAVSCGRADIARFVLDLGSIHADAYHRAATLAASRQDVVMIHALERREYPRA